MNKQHIQSALAAIPTGDFRQTSEALLATLGYRSERTLELSGTVEEFIQEFPALNPNTKTEQAFRNNVESVQLLFQFTTDEVLENTQQTLDLGRGFSSRGLDGKFPFLCGYLESEKLFSQSICRVDTGNQQTPPRTNSRAVPGCRPADHRFHRSAAASVRSKP